MDTSAIQIHTITDDDRTWVRQVYGSWGADFVVTRGRKVFADQTEGIYATGPDGRRIGLLTYEIVGDQCEVVTLDAFAKFQGIGTLLMERMREIAKERGCKRLWLITTNDNLDAIRFYHRRGLVIAAVHVDAIAYSRQLKPTIALVGAYGIPIRDEIEFEMIV